MSMQNQITTKEPKWRRIEASKPWALPNFAEVWHVRGLIRMLLTRDFRLRYRQTMLGVTWVVLQPVMMSLVYSVVFGLLARLPSDNLPYLLFVYSGNVLWSIFPSTSNRVSTSLLSNLGLISKVYFPRLALPITGALSSFIDFCTMMPFLAIMLVFYQVPISLNIIFAPFFVLLMMLSGAGIGMIVASFGTRYRDVIQALPILLQLLTYISPISYSMSIIPENLLPFYLLNPFATIILGFRWALLGLGEISPFYLIYASVFSVGVFLLGSILFRHAERSAVDVL